MIGWNVFIANANDSICPSYDKLYPCFCSFMPKYNSESSCHENFTADQCLSSVITCVGNGIKTLSNIFEKIGHHNNQNGKQIFEWWYLVDTELSSLEDNLLKNVYVENIYLQNCPKLLFLGEHMFGGESRLHVKSIYINATMLSDEPKMKRKTFKALSRLTNLNVLEIQQSSIVTLPFKAFNKFTSVKTIRFYNPNVRQKLSKISPKAFYRANKVTEIDLKYNQISHIGSYAFHFQMPSDHEVKIYLSGNSLHSNSFLPKAFNGGNGRRFTLYLGDYDQCNLLLKTLKQEVFESFLLENRYNVIDMYACPLVCDQKMDWLIGNNQFKNQIRNFVCYTKHNFNNTDKYEYYHI